jgi:hypothetical protein
MNAKMSALLGGVFAALVAVSPVSALPPPPALEIEVSPTRMALYPLGTARVEMVLTNPTVFEQSFVLEILLLRPDGSVVTTYLSDGLALAPGITTFATYSVRHADGAVRAVVTPRRYPDLAPEGAP